MSFAILVSRLRGVADPREYGSKNPGATNVFRSGDRVAGLLTFLGDFGKGYLSVFVTNSTSALLLDEKNALQVIIFVSLAVVLGHIYPIFHGFKGGKGVATTFGVLLAFSVVIGVIAAFIWLVSFFITRVSGFAAVLTAFSIPILAYFIIDLDYFHDFWFVYGMICLLSILLLLRHSDNIYALKKKFRLTKR